MVATSQREAAAEAITLLSLIKRLPRRIDRLTDALEHGHLSLNIGLFADDRDRSPVCGLLHQALLTVLATTTTATATATATATGIMAVLLLGTTGGPVVAKEFSLYELLAYLPAPDQRRPHPPGPHHRLLAPRRHQTSVNVRGSAYPEGRSTAHAERPVPPHDEGVSMCSRAWPMLTSSLATLLETGEPLPAPGVAADVG
ncbi:hypothetical protein ACFWP7_28915 [Streptomyces sp. NPDC058470]|uniref:hypothetical protein n=1 Tax=Streptomyces sp. NPDC058470 TaxID=3346515 RepID=UPI003665F79A